MVQKLLLNVVGGEEKGGENNCKHGMKTEAIIRKEPFLIVVEFRGKLTLK